MRFEVLGELAVRDAQGRVVRVPELKVRALLADLLLQAGRPLSADRLTEDLWGAHPPGNPVNTLQTKVSQLRRAFETAEPGGRELVVHRQGGYLLRAGPESIDAAGFRALTAEARSATDPGAKAALLSEALGLWRGPALPEFADEPFAAPEVSRLEEERLAASEEWAEARLALGEIAGLPAELGELVTRYPLREHLRALYLKALYRSGRQTEALQSYTEIRRLLADELGLAPGPELTAVHRAILVQDPALAGPAAQSPGTNLPASLTELLGRTEEVRGVRAALAVSRLVTLTGPGGVGKTRLAVESARQALAGFADGAWFVEFGPGQDEWVAEAVASIVGVRADRGAAALAAALRGKAMLLVLDNCEQVAGPVAELAARVLAAAPAVRVLVTSREPLGLPGELVRTVAPLPVPEDEGSAGIARSPAVRLFTARAAEAAPGFVLDEAASPVVAALCRRLDGIPLALELAATRVRSLGVHELLRRLDDRFRLLTGGRRGPARQRTLRATIDWSWDLLTEPERVVLRRLAAHTDGCTLESAEAVCAGDDVGAAEVFDLLARLVDRSLVTVAEPAPGAGVLRYRLLESVSAYGRDRLAESGETERVRRKHRDYHLGLVSRAAEGLRGHEQRHWLRRLDAETGNLRAVLDGVVRHGEAAVALRLADGLAWYWFLRGRLGEAHRWLTRALALDGEARPEARARVAAWQAGFAALLGDETDVGEQARRALKLFDDVDDPVGLATAQWFLGFALIGSGDLSALAELTDRALAGFRALGDRWGTAAALTECAVQARPRGELARARRDAERGLALFRELGDDWGRLKAFDVLSSLAAIAGEYDQAGRWYREQLKLAENLGLRIEESYALSGLGRIALLDGDHTASEEFHRRALRVATEQSHKRGMQFAETGLGLVARRQGRFADAEAHLLPWVGWCRERQGDLGVALLMAELGFAAEQRGDAETALRRHRAGLAAAMAAGDPRAVALALEGLAGAEVLRNRAEFAVRLLGAAAAARRALGAPLPEAERGDVERITTAAVARLGEAGFAERFSLGGEEGPEAALTVCGHLPA
ncbi:BTAD domain-containing putative transcriptional regulator [Amycolatopsis rhizosphaerae]|uniref:BTAD domain-containing putative transcriptional regulator n=1 Tax=Amycolatopsis rhizosphaerae TaxID=2053003 RepID=UPI001C951989|nr:BTAD domain-containing putative transcriptional regulator [Amycolatopsis rhizosphaerae]